MNWHLSLTRSLTGSLVNSVHSRADCELIYDEINFIHCENSSNENHSKKYRWYNPSGPLYVQLFCKKYNSQIMQRNPNEKQHPMPNIEHIFLCKIKHIRQCFSFLIDEKCGWKNDESLNQLEKKKMKKTNKQTIKRTTTMCSPHKNITLMSTANSSNYES